MTPVWVLIVQAMAAIAQVITIVFLLVQLSLTRAQVRAAQESIQSQQAVASSQTTAAIRVAQGANLLEVIKYLEEPRHLDARRTVDSIGNKPFHRWNRNERRAADTVWRLWTIAPILQRMGLLPPNYLHYYYGHTIIRHWNLLKPMILERRKRISPGTAGEFEQTATEVEVLGWFANGEDNRPRDRYSFLTGGDPQT